MLKSFRPQQGLPIMNWSMGECLIGLVDEFPSPTGVTYYELW